ncbi:SIS domain-containing protein [Cohnella caldifontis]|uniref:SIS domain-containing protein n=1 Tax=Cohnella caldifontis TaxID=3027471 RepID=UPI0023ECE211|nr:SIS domain-containing protein [Cohnella sp. YIM B05605]
MSSRMRQEIRDTHEVSLAFARSDRSRFGHLHESLRSRRHVILMGTGASLNACKVGQYAFLKEAGFLPHVVPAADVSLLESFLGADDLVLLVSQSGESYETKAAIEAMKRRGVPVWGITNASDSALARLADETILMEAGEEVSSATKSYAATLLILNAIAAGENEAFWQALAALPDAVRDTLSGSDRKIADWAGALAKREKFYLLGVREFGVTAQQGALVLKEKTFQHAEGMSLSEFRHGNVEVVQPGLPIVIVAGADSLDESLGHAEFLASLEAEVYLIADRAAAPAKIPADRILVLPGVSGLMPQITTVLPLMQLAENIASAKGYDVDGFRYISKVVSQY